MVLLVGGRAGAGRAVNTEQIELFGREPIGVELAEPGDRMQVTVEVGERLHDEIAQSNVDLVVALID